MSDYIFDRILGLGKLPDDILRLIIKIAQTPARLAYQRRRALPRRIAYVSIPDPTYPLGSRLGLERVNGPGYPFYGPGY